MCPALRDIRDLHAWRGMITFCQDPPRAVEESDNYAQCTLEGGIQT